MSHAAEIVLAGNGPGELRGWIRPVARQLRVRAADQGPLPTLTLALTPSQFAGGREHEVVARWGLFDRILDPATTVRTALGLSGVAVTRPAALVHLGGDLLLSGRLARRLGIPAAAFAETPLVATRHRYFARVFAATDALAADLRRRGVPVEKIVVTGDPRADAFAMPSPESSPDVPSGDRSVSVVSFLPGSRDRFLTVLAPFFHQAATVAARAHPKTCFQFIVSEFLTPATVEAVRRRIEAANGAQIHWILEEGWQAVTRSDFVVTIPGTNTLELALAGVPFAVVVPTDFMDRAAVEGLWEWVARLPGLGGWLRRAALHRYLARHRFLAIPNQRVGRAVVPEWIGPLSAADVGRHMAEALSDAGGRAAIARALRDLALGRPGAAGCIAAEALRLAAASGTAS
ncbi:MAG: hypothetical protein QN114_09020 [Armatimonadota bacterium]|nr:hypothetical protein [Armatimonadota bacterium]